MTAARQKLPEVLRIHFHNAYMNSEPIELDNFDDYDMIIKLARQYARRIKVGLRTDRPNNKFWFSAKREYGARRNG
jgi:hypothetical protein